jgi:hypothetical protein
MHAPHRIGRPRRWRDWVLAADPGLAHLQAAWRTLVSLVVGFATGYGMAHAVDIPSQLGLMVGGVLGLISALIIAENTPLRLARALLWMPIPFSAVLSLGVWLHPHHTLEFWLVVAAMAPQFFLSRFGSLGIVTGNMLFTAFLIGFVTKIPLDDCGWLFIVAMVSAVALLVARLVFCYPRPREDLLRTQRAFVIEARRVANTAVTALDPDADRAFAIKRIRRTLSRLNVTTLTIDGRLAQPEVAADPHAAELLHQYLFDAEVALQGIGQAVQELSRRHVPSALREAMVVGLVIARDAHLGRVNALRPAAELIRQEAANAPEGMGPDEAETRALARRVADLLDALADSLAYWLNLGWNTTTQAKVPFQPSVVLEAGIPAGTGPAARRLAAAQHGKGWRRAIPPSLRSPLQMAIAAAITLPLADAVNGQHFYWGAIGVLIALKGVNTVPERVRKLGHRVVGTVVGSVIGIALVYLIGLAHPYWTLLVIVAAMSLGVLGMQRQYLFFVTGLVVALVQLYGMATPSGELDTLLTQRLVENGMGMAVATICAALLFPVSTPKVAREAEHGYLSALEQLVAQIAERWKSPDAPVRPRGAARGVNAAFYQMQSVVRPLIRMRIGTWSRGRDNLLALLGTATRHANALAAAADTDIDLPAQPRIQVERITEVFTNSLHALDRQLTTGQRDGTWVRVSPMIRELQNVVCGPDRPGADRLYAALGELAALDEVLASLADNRGLRVTTIFAPAPAETPSRGYRAAPADTPTTPKVPRTGRPTAPQMQEAHAARATRSRAATDTVGHGRHHHMPTGRNEAAGAGMGDLMGSGSQPPRPIGTTSGGASESAVTVRGALRCPEHDGCEVWITVVNDRGKYQGKCQARSNTFGGSYAITGLTPGEYTLIVSGSQHRPRAESLLVDGSGRDVQHDITLTPAP